MNGTADPAPSSRSSGRRTRKWHVPNGSALCSTCRGIGVHLDDCTVLCSCGKPVIHLDAPEDSDEWACLVRDPHEYTPPSWLHDERGHPGSSAGTSST